MHAQCKGSPTYNLWKSATECQDMMKSAARKIGGVTKILWIAIMLCVWSGVSDCQMAPSLDGYSPRSGPIAGGTEINVTGEGFVTTGADRSKCKFERSLRGSTLSEQNILHNETFLTCYLPEIEYLSASMLQGGEIVRFTITGATGSDSNDVEFFLYDLVQIQVQSISPMEGLANSTNLTLSIVGENFLNTNELTCSVAGSYKVPAQYINSSLLQCQLAPFPETRRVVIDVSMNGQAVANISPFTENSTLFTYFASPPRIQSCRFTLSYAQLLLSFDREVEIGGEQRANDTIQTSSKLSCSEIFMRETLENIIGLNSICFWYNTRQREVVIQLSSDTSVELGSQIVIRNDTIRTRYVQYSRLASGNVVVSLPDADSPQFLPMAIIEAPSIIPYCGNFTVSGAKSQYGGSRGLQYMWIIGTRYNENGTLIQDRILADHVPTGFTSQSLLELSSDLFNPDLLGSGSGSGAPLMLASSFDIQLHVRNFLGYTSTASITNITRAEIAQPSVLIVGGDSRRVGISDETILEGRVIPPSDACLIPMQDEPVAYTWRVTDQYGKEINLDDTPHSSVLVLPPYSLELGSEYIATLSVDFNSFIVEASTTLMTDVELFDLVASISGGVRRSVGMNEDILLDGQRSQYVNTSSLVLDVTWTCATTASNEECADRDGQALSFSTNDLVQVISSSMLQPGEYNFSLTLQLMSDSQDSAMLEATTYQVVVIFPFSVPRVEIIQTDSTGMNLESVLVHKELILTVGVQSHFPGSGQWTSEYVIGYAQLGLNDVVIRSPLRYNITNVNSQRPKFSDTMPLLFTNNSYANSSVIINQLSFVIAGNTLLPQNTYRFKFTTYNEFGISGFAEVDIYTESVPISGSLLISPQNGSPLTTIFSLSAPGWTDNLGDTPLLYQFGLRYIFFNTMEWSNSGQLLQPSCCSLMNDNNISILENVSCVCDFFSTGVSEQNDLQTMLPFLPQTMNRVAVQAELLVHVFDKNGARTEASQALDSIFSEPATDDDSTQLLRPMLDTPSSEQLDTLAMLDRIRQLSWRSWRDALAQLTTLVSFAEVSSFNSPYFNLSQAQIVQFKVKATEIVLDIYESYVPLSKPYLSVIASLLQSTTNSLNTLNDELTSKIIAFVRVLIGSYNSFDEESVFSLPGFSTTESQSVLNILQNLMSTTTSDSVIRVQANSITQELLSVVPKLGFGLCTSERYSFVSGASASFLKASKTNLPSVYQSIEQCNARQANYSRRTKYCLSEDRPKVTVNFSSALFQRYLWWPCAAAVESSGNVESELYCSGVCLTSAQHTQNLLWQGSEYEARLKSLLFQLYLLNPLNGSVLEISASMVTPTRLVRKTAADSEQVDLVFPILAGYSNASNLQCAYWNGTSRMWIRRTQFTGEMKHRNGTVSDVVCQFGVTLGSIFTVLEVCPDGYYGETCSNICPEGLWGGECRGLCDCSNRGDCSPIDGSCDCDPGWMGDSCETKCPTGMWGKGCLEVCLCENGAECNRITGACTCTPGWMETYCNTSCPDGLFGSNCLESCICNKDEECNKMTGFCNCSAGFMGPTCHQHCPNGSHGLNCASQCQCFVTGTRSCHHVNGSCDCLDRWTGDLCEVEVTPPPEPTFQIWWAIVGAVVAVLLALLVVCLIIIIFVVMRKKKRKKVLPITDDETGDHVSHQKDAIGDEIATNASGSSVSDLNITRAKSLEVLVPKGKELTDIFISHADKKADGEEEESDFKEPAELDGKLRWQIIRLIPAKSKSQPSRGEVKDILPPQVNGAGDLDKKTTAVDDSDQPRECNEELEDLVKKEIDGDSSLEVSKITQESPRSGGEVKDILPLQVNGAGDLDKKTTAVDDSDQPGECNEELEDLVKKEIDGDSSLEVSKITQESPRSKYSGEPTRSESADDHMTEVLYKRGVYLTLDATLKDLRNGFIEIEKLENNDRYFQLLKSDVPGDFIEIDTEDETFLSQIEHRLVQQRTMYIENIDPATVTMELCVCGKFADLECSECGLRGYCSVDCQQDDWFKHTMICQEKVEERKQQKKSKSSKSKKKKKHKKHKKHKKSKSRASSSFTPSIDVCICGKEAEFECSRCEKQGYCSEECQLKDWTAHQMYCTEQSGHDTQPGGEDELQHEDSDDASNSDSKVKNASDNENGPFNRSGLETVMEETEESEEDNK